MVYYTMAGTTWQSFIRREGTKPYFQELRTRLKRRYEATTVYPPKEDVMNAFKMTPLEKVKVVILGQDPYYNEGQAHGLSFSVKDGVDIPPSLKNVFKEIHSSLGIKIQRSGNLERWARQGVFLLNSVLTVEAGRPASHKEIGWQSFTDNAIKLINDERDGVAFMLWGNYARSKGDLIDRKKHHVLEAAHPSPLSAYKGFFGCDHFRSANFYLGLVYQSSINWS